MDDTISRRAAINAFEKRFVSKNGNIIALTFEGCKKVIENLPPADVPERKKGRWIMHIDDLFPEESTMECNQCHEHQPVTIDDNYCPNCGADMRGEE